jgi:hypothetical protein
MSSLTENEKKKILEAYQKLKEKNLEIHEAEQLQTCVESRKEEAFNVGDIALGMGLILLGAALVIYKCCPEFLK